MRRQKKKEVSKGSLVYNERSKQSRGKGTESLYNGLCDSYVASIALDDDFAATGDLEGNRVVRLGHSEFGVYDIADIGHFQGDKA